MRTASRSSEYLRTVNTGPKISSRAIRIANDSDYGLAGSVWTADVAHGLGIAAEIRAGTYGINMYTLDTSAPFGGFKQSGIGREFGPEGLSQYTEVQSTVTAGE